eukprot:11287180-Ditylum_brightwellii.AAC.1
MPTKECDNGASDVNDSSNDSDNSDSNTNLLPWRRCLPRYTDRGKVNDSTLLETMSTRECDNGASNECDGGNSNGSRYSNGVSKNNIDSKHNDNGNINKTLTQILLNTVIKVKFPAVNTKYT